jgi:uncharacterized protein HemX
MPVMSAKLGEALVRTTQAKDIEDAFNKVFSEYLELKLNQLQNKIDTFREKFGMNFEEFNKRAREKKLKDDIYSFEAETNYWEWEEAVTLKEHYTNIKHQWM